MPQSSLKFTQQQQEALETRDVSVALSAGAGCGKTFILTQRFLSHLTPGENASNLNSIVAITFTERAAREMRDRIREACQQRLDSCPDQDAAYWLGILRGLDTARISTIHSFCSSLLRTHSIEAQLDPQFRLFDQAEADACLRQIVSDSIFELLSQHDEQCKELVLNFGLEKVHKLVRSLVQQRFRIEFEQFENLSSDQLSEIWSDHWRETHIPSLIKDLAAAPNTQFLIQLLTEHETTHEKMQQRRIFLLDQLPQLGEAGITADFISELAEQAKVQGGGTAKHWPSPEIYESIKQSFTSLRKSLAEISDAFNLELDDFQLATQHSQAVLAVTQHTLELYELYKQKTGSLDFDDLLIRTRNLLRDSEPVRRKAAADISFLMVDEFQDTDPVQAEIVRHLCGQQLLSGKLFLVGDAKQSIYRFRRADPAVFHELRSEIPKAGQLPLSKNFRSQPEILNFVNCLFTESMGEDYEPLLPHQNRQLSPQPSIEFLFANIPDKDEPNDSAETIRKREADWMARRIKTLLDDETKRVRFKNVQTGVEELRRPQLGDFVILFRTLSNVAFYEHALRELGLDYYLVGGKAFYAQQEIYDLINLCQYLEDCDDLISLAGTLRSPFFCLTDDTLFTLANSCGNLRTALQQPPPECLPTAQKKQVDLASRVLQELQSKKDRLSIVQLLNRAMDLTGYDAALLHEFLGRRKLANLRKLIEKARQFDSNGQLSLRDFVHWMRDCIKEETAEELAATHPESNDVLRLMTIHQSKGLEFPIVIVGDMNWSQQKSSSLPHLHSELGPIFDLPEKRGKKPINPGAEIYKREEKPENQAETIRLLYVALTRAADHLILSSGLPTTGKKSLSPWLQLLAQRFDIQTGLPVADPYLGRIAFGDIEPDQIPEIRAHHCRPEVVTSIQPISDGRVSLSKIRETVSAATSAPLPTLLGPVSATDNSNKHLSVSEIEAFDSVPASHSPVPINQAAELDRQSSQQLGTLVHAVLEKVDFKQPGDYTHILSRWVETNSSGLDQTVIDQATQRIETFLNSDVATRIANSQRCFRELDFRLRWPSSNCETTITGMIDCLIQEPDGSWAILDYKTGFNAVDDETIIAKHELQLAIYAFAATELIGRTPDNVELILIQEGIHCLPINFNENRLSELSNRVDTAISNCNNPEFSSV